MSVLFDDNPTMSVAFLFTIFSAGILGSTHCAGMCGPLAHFVSRNLKQNISYNSGRGLGYASVGALFGGLGQILLDSEILWLREVGTALAVIFVIFSLWSFISKRHFSIFLPPQIRTRFFNFARRKGELTKGFYLGLLTMILPCGWLMTFAGVAAASASIANGILVMLAFWLSTLPMMTLAPLTAHKWFEPLRKKSPILVTLLLAASSFFVLGFRFYSKHSCH